MCSHVWCMCARHWAKCWATVWMRGVHSHTLEWMKPPLTSSFTSRTALVLLLFTRTCLQYAMFTFLVWSKYKHTTCLNPWFHPAPFLHLPPSFSWSLPIWERSTSLLPLNCLLFCSLFVPRASQMRWTMQYLSFWAWLHSILCSPVHPFSYPCLKFVLMAE